MLLTSIRAGFRPFCTLKHHNGTALAQGVVSQGPASYHSLSSRRFCSSRSGKKHEGPGNVLNRPPTLDCLFPESKGEPTSTGGLFVPEIEALYRGNQRFRDIIAKTTPDLLKDLAAQGQSSSSFSFINLCLEWQIHHSLRTAIHALGLFG